MQVKVWNDNDHDLKTRFKGDEVIIPAHEFKMMEFYEAHEFKGVYHPILRDAGGQQDPASMKIIRIEKMVQEGEEDPTSVTLHSCMKCKKSYESSPVLEAHIKTAHAEDETLTLPEVDEKIKRKKKAG